MCDLQTVGEPSPTTEGVPEWSSAVHADDSTADGPQIKSLPKTLFDFRFLQVSPFPATSAHPVGKDTVHHASTGVKEGCGVPGSDHSLGSWEKAHPKWRKEQE